MANPPTQPPQIEPLQFGRLEAGMPESLAPRADLEDVEFAPLSLERLDLAGAVVRSSRFTGLRAGETDLRGSRLTEVDLDGVDLPVVHAARGQWRDVRWHGRLGSVEAYESQWRGVHLVGCKLSFVNLRGAELQDVAFTDCTIEELDLTGARLRRVRFADTQVRHLDLQGADLEHVDLRGATLESIAGVSDLRGAVVTADQLTLLAPLLAESIGLRVEG